jgi:hypothetical protein
MRQTIEEVKSELAAHLVMCHQALEVTERENRAFQEQQEPQWGEFCGSRKKVLADLRQLLQTIRETRLKWTKLDPKVRTGQREIAELICHNQNAIMKVIVLDRENERLFLKRGLVPAEAIPAAARQRPHYVADMYQRHQSRV